MSFSQQLSDFRTSSLQRAEQHRRAIIMKLFSAVILDTPVDTGRARSNWIVSTGKPTRITVEKVDDAGAVIEDAQAEVEQSSGDVVVYLNNNLPYIVRLENGWSKQAPEGMVRKNVARIQRLVDQAIKEGRLS